MTPRTSTADQAPADTHPNRTDRTDTMITTDSPCKTPGAHYFFTSSAGAITFTTVLPIAVVPMLTDEMAAGLDKALHVTAESVLAPLFGAPPQPTAPTPAPSEAGAVGDVVLSGIARVCDAQLAVARFEDMVRRHACGDRGDTALRSAKQDLIAKLAHAAAPQPAVQPPPAAAPVAEGDTEDERCGPVTLESELRFHHEFHLQSAPSYKGSLLWLRTEKALRHAMPAATAAETAAPTSSVPSAPASFSDLSAEVREALDEMDSCIRISREYLRAGEKTAEINPDDIRRWRLVLCRTAAPAPHAAAQASQQPVAGGGLYRKKPVIVPAKQWFKPGDHPAVILKSDPHRYADAGIPWCPTLEGGHVVTPGDWVITGVKGEHYPCKPDIFADTYEAVIPAAPVAMEQPAAPTPAPGSAVPQAMTEAPKSGTAYWRAAGDTVIGYRWREDDFDFLWLSEGCIYRTEADARAAIAAQQAQAPGSGDPKTKEKT